MAKEIVAEGVWCPECESFEQADFFAGSCISCGCIQAIHREVEVVTTS